MSRREKLILGFLASIFLYLLIFQVIAIWPFTIDDMYISLRYAKNWTFNHSLLWNLNEEPVEGYSNFSFVVLAAFAMKLGLNPVVILKSAGAFGLILTTIAVYFLSRFWTSLWFACLPCFWLLFYRGEIFWSISGLETTIYQAMICFSLAFLLRGMGYRLFPKDRTEPNSTFFMLAGLMLALAGLTRPEAPALMLLFFIIAAVDSPKKFKAKYYQGLMKGALICGLIFVPYFLWRWNYYGHLFPNPVYCKSFMNFLGQMDKNYLILAYPFLILSAFAIYKAKDKKHYFFWLPSLLYLVLLIDADTVSAFDNRLFLPAFSLLLPLAFAGLAQLCAYFCVEKNEVYKLSLISVAFWLALAFIPSLSLNAYRYFTINPQAGNQLRQQVANWLNHNIPAGSQVVLADAGIIPYQSSMHYIDSYCLNNKTMTVAPRKRMFERLCEEVFIKKPQVLILTIYKGKEGLFYAPADLCLYKKLKENKSYQFRVAYEVNTESSLYRYEMYTLVT